MSRITSIIKLVLGVFFSIIGLIIIVAGEYKPGLFLIALAILILPILTSLKKSIPIWGKLILGIIFIIGFFTTLSPSKNIQTNITNTQTSLPSTSVSDITVPQDKEQV